LDVRSGRKGRYTSLSLQLTVRERKRVTLSLEKFVSRWPYAYHLTSRNNFRPIHSSGRLESASSLLIKAGRVDLAREKRSTCMNILVKGVEISLRDQAPLHEKNIAFEDRWQFGDLVEALNGLVFFWTGKASGPNPYGLRHFERYAAESPILLRVDNSELLAANPEVTPLFCGFNSGSPRYSNGAASPRGPRTFLDAREFAGTPRKVVELTFPSDVLLPPTTEYGHSPGGPWTELSEAAVVVD